MTSSVNGNGHQVAVNQFKILIAREWAVHVAAHSAKIWRFLRKAGQKMGSREPRGYDRLTASPSLLERSGIHVMREIAVKWCRDHPVEAEAMPGWNLDILKRILEGVA